MKIKKQLLSLSAACAMLFSVFMPDSVNNAITASAEFERTASETVEDIVFGWNLGNTLDAYSGTVFGAEGVSSETSWGNQKTTKEMIDMVKDTGINAIRVPVTWYNHMDPNTYKIDEAWMNRVEEIVNYVLDGDTYCIINVHHDTGEKGWLRASSANFDKNKVIFESMWEQISERFESYGDKLLFEGFNEILDDNNEWVNPDQSCLTNVNTLNQLFVDTVRESGGNNAERVLICNTYAASGNPYVTSGFKLPEDSANNKLIAECHVYQPFYFTTEASPNETTWENNKIYLDEQLDAIKSNFIDKGIPSIIGEFGAAEKNNIDEIISWAEYYVEKCKSYGIKCFWWDNGTTAGYKLFNRNTLKPAQENLINAMLAKANGGSYEIDKTVYGDANDDGIVTIDDAVMLQKWLLGSGELTAWKNVDLCKDDVINAFDLCALKRLLAEKENLCSDENNWTSWVDASTGAEADIKYLSNGMSVSVTGAGKNIWDIQATYSGITLENGATYKLSFDYTSTTNMTMDCNVMQNYDPYSPYYTANLDYTSDTKHHESTFTMTKATDKNTRISFNLGAGKNVPFTVTIQNLSLVKISDGNAGADPEPTEPVTPDSKNLCEDSSNWGGWVYEDGASADINKLSDGITIDVTNPGTEEWHIQGSYSNLTLTKGTTYRVEFDYSSTTEVPLGFHVQQNYDPYGQYHYENVNCTTSTQHYSAEFTMTETDDNVVCVFNCGGVDLSIPFSITVQNLSLVPIS